MSQKNPKDILIEFGLTSKEADVYIFLAKYEILRGGEIAKRTKIDRSFVYRLLKSLQAKGLVEPTIESPTRFVAVPFEKAIDLIIKSRQEEARTVEKAKQDLIKDWKTISKIKPKVEYERFMVIEGNKKIYQKILQMIKETKNHFSGILPVSNLVRAEQFGVFDSAYSHPIKSRIKFQFVTEANNQNIEAVKLFKSKLKRSINLKAGDPESEGTSIPRLVIRDNEDVMFFIRPESATTIRRQSDVCVYTNCASLIQTFNGIFQGLWHNSVDLETKIIEIETGKPAKPDLSFRKKSDRQTSEMIKEQGVTKSTDEETFKSEDISNFSLQEEERDILDVASVIGGDFSLEAIEKVTGSSRFSVLKTLVNIENKSQLISSVGNTFSFVNSEVREALYNDIKPRLKRAYHALVAEYFEELNKNQLEDFTNCLAHHYYHSKNAKKAIPYLLKAGKNLRNQFAFAEAVKNYSQALEMMHNDELWKKEKIEALDNLGDIYASIGEHEKANDSYTTGIFIAENEPIANIMKRKIRRKRTIENNGLKIQYSVYGEGDPTILFVGRSNQFMPQIQYFSQKHKVAIMDLNKIWETKHLPTEYTLDLFTENLKAIIEDLQDTNIFLVSLALGGTLAIRYVAKYSGHVAKLVLLATPPKSFAGDSAESKKLFKEFWAKALQSPSWGLKNFWEKVLPPTWSRTQVEGTNLSNIRKSEHRMPPEIRLITFKLLSEADARPFLEKIKVPTLILHGEKDILPIKDVKYIKENITDSQLYIFKDAAIVSLSMAEKFNKVLEEFLYTGHIQRN